MPNEQTQSSSTDTAQILRAIQQMLTGVGEATGAKGGGPAMIPGQQGPSPAPTITFDPRGAGTQISHAPAPQRPSIPPTGSQGLGEYSSKRGAVNAGLTSLGNSLSGIFSTVEQKEHAKKSALAENYLLQINGLLSSGDPNDRKKAEMILEDPKIRKILKTGLEYVPLEEEVPPEAMGVKSAVSKIMQDQTHGGPQPQKQMRPVLPQASPQQQLQAALTNAMLQKIKQDPASAISMMGGSQLTSAEQHADEFYKSGLGLSPADIATMTAQEKLAGLKIYEAATSAAIRGEIDMYKAQLGYKGKVDSATILGNARKYVGDALKASRDKSGKVNNFAAGARIYEDYAKKYLDIIKGGKGPDGKPLTEEQMKAYQQKADSYQRQADEYLNQAGDTELFMEFQKALEAEDPNASSDNQ